ncbi:hypothetical protein AB0F11_36615, partial [Streptomyces sp. NPDC032472]
MGRQDTSGTGRSRGGQVTPGGSGGAPSGRRGASGTRRRPRKGSGRRWGLPPALRTAFASALSALAPVLAAVRPQLRRLRPAYPRPGRSGWR